MSVVDARTQRLHAALAEQARLGELYEQAVGTESEQSRYAQLRAASVRVARYERLAEVSPAPAHSEPA
ncbi:MAG: hypothetical protein NVSMB25_14130 [Thermoleophilaceae bacterium]